MKMRALKKDARWAQRQETCVKVRLERMSVRLTDERKEKSDEEAPVSSSASAMANLVCVKCRVTSNTSAGERTRLGYAGAAPNLRASETLI